MPSLIDFRRRIRAVKNTQQITKAMKMVAASRFRKAQERILGARPFQTQMLRVLHNLASHVDEDAHPLFAMRDLDQPGSRVLMILVTADKGLCGGFNTNLIKMATGHVLAHRSRQYTFSLVGRKGRDFVRRRRLPVHLELVNIFNDVKFVHAQEIAQDAIEAFTSGEVDGVELVYNEFKSVLQQRPMIERCCRSRGCRPRNRWPAGSTTSTSPTRRRSSTGCCPGTWPSTSSTRCSSRRPPSTARA